MEAKAGWPFRMPDVCGPPHLIALVRREHASRTAVEAVTYNWKSGDETHAFKLVFVRGTDDLPFSFGEGATRRSVHIQDFFIGAVPVTQALWTHVMGPNTNPSVRQGADLQL